MSVTTDHLVAERVHVPSQYDAILKITSTCICGSDLHMYTGAFPGVRKGDQLGHEVDFEQASLLHPSDISDAADCCIPETHMHHLQAHWKWPV